ncbi:hypothetical protein ANN_22248 [Periplaneta americana]|uniref:EB domain-containing protein n=1 Tax=Periplaneta americana TaxID=6978 RepID=A0ABQ8S861_PERAM|nr:hypothetical protein ANN_22248 [Periplaneta americana]
MLTASCNADTDCKGVGWVCKNYKCDCDDAYYLEDEQCTKKKVGLDHACAVASDCGLVNSIRSLQCLNARCSCELGFRPTANKTDCVPLVGLGKSCSLNEECKPTLSAKPTECWKGVCSCKPGLRATPSLDCGPSELKRKMEKLSKEVILQQSACNSNDIAILTWKERTEAQKKGKLSKQCILQESICNSSDIIRLLRPSSAKPPPDSSLRIRKSTKEFSWTTWFSFMTTPGLIDYHVFGPLKKFLVGQRFTSDDDNATTTIRRWFRALPAEFYNSCISKLVVRWDTFLNRGGDYVEK